MISELRKHELRLIIDQSWRDSDYRRIYCLSLAKRVAESGGCVVFYSCTDSAKMLQQKLNDIGFELGYGKITIKTFMFPDLTAIRKQIEIDATLMKNLKLIIIDDCLPQINDYRSYRKFFIDVKMIMLNKDIACIFTSLQKTQFSESEHVSLSDIRFSTGAADLCDTIYGIKTQRRFKLNFIQYFLNIFRRNKKPIKRENVTYLSVIKNRFKNSNDIYKLQLQDGCLNFSKPD